MKNTIKVLTIVSILLSSTTLLAQTGFDAAENARARLRAEGHDIPYTWQGAKKTVTAPLKTVENVNITITKKEADERDYNLSGTVAFTVNGKAHSCSFENLELSFGSHEDLCDDNGFYPSVKVDGDSYETRLYAHIKESIDYRVDPVLKSGFIKIGPGIRTQTSEARIKGAWDLKMEAGPY